MNLSEVQVSRSALRHNATQLKQLVPPGMKVVAVVKANAYGHGLAQVVESLEDLVDAFQVDDIEELRDIRRHTDHPVLVLGHVLPEDIQEAANLGGELALFDKWQIEPFRQAQVKAHLEIDSLLGRLGQLSLGLDTFLSDARGLNVVAAYGHFSNLEDTTDQAQAYAQIDTFESAWDKVRAAFPGAIRHMSATSGLMAIEPIRRGYGLARLGIGLYGLYPSLPLSRTHAFLELRPAMRWVSHVAQVKELPARHPVGYGMSYVTSKPMRVAVIPQGYSDGYDRGLSNVGGVLIRGKRCPVLGRVAMNMFTVDVMDTDVEPHDEVVILGAQGDNVIHADEVANSIGTIHYEMVARVSPLLPRVLVP